MTTPDIPLDEGLEWLDLAEASAHLGITPDAARKRIKRKSLEAIKHEGRWFVAVQTGLDKRPDEQSDAAGQTSSRQPDNGLTGVTGELIEQLRQENTRLQDDVADLRRRLDEESESHRSEIERRDEAEHELRLIIARLAERLPQLASPATVQPDNQDVQPEADMADREEENRPWWRFW